MCVVMKRVVDLFAGCGGMSLGFQNAGFDIVAAFEYWETAAMCYENNFGHPVFRDDLANYTSAIEKIKIQNPDIIIGGPPCQDFSHAGKRIEGNRANLTESYAKIISAIKPQYFVMENVDRIQKSTTYGETRKIFKDNGYGLTEVTLNASLCGVPQRRKRFFCIGALNAADDFLLDYIKNNLDEKEMTLRDFFGESLDFDYYYRHPRNYSRRAVYTIDEPSPTIRGMNRPVPPGYPGHPNDAKELDGSIRPMTTLERALVQTFPANFKWNGNKTDMEQMIGNAVPVKLAEFVAKALLYQIESNSSILEQHIDCDSFYKWLLVTQPLSERVKKDTVSRLRRANSMCVVPPNPQAHYIFLLEQSEGFKMLTPTVRSQLKRAVSLYADYKSAVQV